jgi:hypothetical protein
MTASDLSQYGISLLDQYVLLIALLLVALVVVMYLGRRNLIQAWLNAKTRYRLNRLGLKEISNFQFPDGLGNYFNIDRLIMRHDGISLLLVKQYPGSIFCAEDIDEWTQMLAGKSYRFKNPLIDLDYQVKAVSACIPGVPVDGFLFFDTQAEFPKGHPDSVIRSDSIPEALERNKDLKAQASVESAWEKLSALKVTG